MKFAVHSLCVFLAFTFSALAVASKSAVPPNIVLILADDMGFSDLGSFGGEIDTPNLDQLAAEGVRFSQFYNTSRCSTTRASLLTGRYPHTVQMGHLAGKTFSGVDGYRGDLDRDVPTMAEILQGAGYATFLAGKWHLANYGTEDLQGKSIADLDNIPTKRGFDGYFGNMLGGTNYFSPRYLYRDTQLVTDFDKDFYYTDAISEASTDFIRSHFQQKRSSPFFLYVSYTAPHWPIQAPKPLIEKYLEQYQRGWDRIKNERYQKQLAKKVISETSVLSPRPENVPAWKDAENKLWTAQRMATHAAMVESMDRGIGQVIATLKSYNALESTIVLFLSDNGASAESVPRVQNPEMAKMLEKFLGKYTPSSGETMHFGNDPGIEPGTATALQAIGPEWAHVSNAPFRLYKSFVHEGGIATPLIVRGPVVAIEQGEIIPVVGHVIDLLPTLLDYLNDTAGSGTRLSAKVPLHGVSLLPALRGEPLQRGPIFFEHEGNRAVRDGEWKLVSERSEDWELYNMHNDRTEMVDLADQLPDQVHRLDSLYLDYAAAYAVKPWDSIQNQRQI